MCCCGKPTRNGEPGYRWNDPHGPTSVHPVNPPNLQDGDVPLYDEAGRCGDLDSHSYHYMVVRAKTGNLDLLVRHGGGDERIRLSGPKMFEVVLASLDSTNRYWLLNTLYHAQCDAARNARDKEAERWRTAAAQKRIKVRKQRGTGTIRVSIEPLVKLVDSQQTA
jgi:hypothetical protein